MLFRSYPIPERPGVFDRPVDDGKAIHSLEHGIIWISYRPDLVSAKDLELLTAIAAGYEVMIRSSLALNPSAARLRGWHLTGVTGTLGAAAACASLMQLDAEHTAWALGLAGTQSSGTWAFNADGTQSKRLHPGRADRKSHV